VTSLAQLHKPFETDTTHFYQLVLFFNNVVNVVDVLTQIFANICGKEK